MIGCNFIPQNNSFWRKPIYLKIVFRNEKCHYSCDIFTFLLGCVRVYVNMTVSARLYSDHTAIRDF